MAASAEFGVLTGHQAMFSLPRVFLAIFSNVWLFCFSRLYVLQGSLAQQEWRVPELLQRLNDHISPMLGHTYKNVRDRIGR